MCVKLWNADNHVRIIKFDFLANMLLILRNKTKIHKIKHYKLDFGDLRLWSWLVLIRMAMHGFIFHRRSSSFAGCSACKTDFSGRSFFFFGSNTVWRRRAPRRPWASLEYVHWKARIHTTQSCNEHAKLQLSFQAWPSVSWQVMSCLSVHVSSSLARTLRKSSIACLFEWSFHKTPHEPPVVSKLLTRSDCMWQRCLFQACPAAQSASAPRPCHYHYWTPRTSPTQIFLDSKPFCFWWRIVIFYYYS